MAAGRRRAEKVRPGTGPGSLRRVLLLVVGVLLAAVAWVFLVRAAIDFGEAARDGRGAAGWAMTVGAGAGATLSLLLVFVLLARIRETVVPKRSTRSHKH